MAFWGELYVRAYDPILTEETTTGEVGYLGWAFASLPVDGPLLDLGCGTCRHAGRVAALTRRPVLGLDGASYSLKTRRPGTSVVQADFLALPLKDSSLAGAFSWYASVINNPREELVLMLRALIRALKPGGRLILEGTPLTDRLREGSGNLQDHTYLDGTRVTQVADRILEDDRESLVTTLYKVDGSVLKGTLHMIYYLPETLNSILDEVGLEPEWVHGGVDRSPLNSGSLQMIVAAKVKSG